MTSERWVGGLFLGTYGSNIFKITSAWYILQDLYNLTLFLIIRYITLWK